MYVPKLSIVIAISFIAISVGVYYAISSEEISSQTILDTDKTVINQDIQYPSESPHITSKIITIPAGAETGPHTHEYPMFAYVLEGEITVDYGDQGTRTFEKGDSFIEAINYTHNGKNTGSEPTKILTVLIGKN
jgi:quercetin dioxygenase-like cupin family protein